jgi:RHS repeat-associated protein
VVKDISYTYNTANQLTAWSEENGAEVVQRSAVMTYDTRGNRASTAITTHGETPTTTTTSYSWTPQNMLSSVTLPDSSVHSYAYDYRVRRITRTEGSVNPVAMTFSGGLSVAEFEVTNSQLGTLNSQPSVEYQRGPDMGGGVGGLLYSLRSGTAKFNLSNGRGDVVAQSDASGDLTWTASYEAYGKRPVETGSNLDRQRANTKEEDPTGLLNEGFRYRDIETGTWLSRDPAGFVDGPNLYAYVRQNPWTKFDPDGLKEAPAVASQVEVKPPVATPQQSSRPTFSSILNRAGASANVISGAVEAGHLQIQRARIEGIQRVEQYYSRKLLSPKEAEKLINIVETMPLYNLGAADARRVHAEQVTDRVDYFAVEINARILRQAQDQGKTKIGFYVANSQFGLDEGQKAMAIKLGVNIIESTGDNHAEENLLREVKMKLVGTYARLPCGPEEHDCAKQLAQVGVQCDDLLLRAMAKVINKAAKYQQPSSRRTTAVGIGERHQLDIPFQK